MPAVFPGSIKTYTAVTAGSALPFDVVQSLQDEVTAIETTVTPLVASAWTLFTPSWTNLTVGNASANLGRYTQINKLVWFKIDLTFGSTTSIAGSVSVAFPVTAAVQASHSVGHGEAIDASPVGQYLVHVRLSSSTVMAIFVDNGTSLLNLSATAPFTWATSDELHISGFYEAA